MSNVLHCSAKQLRPLPSASRKSGVRGRKPPHERAKRACAYREASIKRAGALSRAIEDSEASGSALLRAERKKLAAQPPFSARLPPGKIEDRAPALGLRTCGAAAPQKKRPRRKPRPLSPTVGSGDDQPPMGASDDRSEGRLGAQGGAHPHAPPQQPAQFGRWRDSGR